MIPMNFRLNPWLATLRPCPHGGLPPDPGSKLLDFSSNVNPLGPSPKAVESIKENLWRIAFYPDPDSQGLRKAISEYIGSISQEDVIVGNGSTELIHLFSEVFIGEGDEALIPEPTFGEYEVAVRKAGGRPRFIEAGPGLRIDADKVLGRIGQSTKVVFLCNPNNPTGTTISSRELLRVVEEAQERDVLVFLDEDFIEFTDDGGGSSLAGLVEEHMNLFITRSLTKVFGLAGLRVGYGLANGEMIEILLRAKPPWNVNCLAQSAAMAALGDEDHLKESRRVIREGRSSLFKGLRALRGFGPLPTEANFILVNIEGSGLSSGQLKRRLLELGILIRDCSSIRGLNSNYVRVAVRLREDNERLLSSLERVKAWPEGP